MATHLVLLFLARATDLLMFATVLSVGWVLQRATGQRSAISPIAVAVVLLAALVWGALWTWYPPLASTRLAAPPGGQAGAIVALIVTLLSLLIVPAVRDYFKHVDAARLVALGLWRLVYGTMLLAIGLLDGLPASFYLSAAVGDLLVGLWALLILTRRESASGAEIVAWNVVGLVDLLHVITLAALHLRPFFIVHPELPPLNLLPLVGVPLFIALHALTLWGLRERQAATLQKR